MGPVFYLVQCDEARCLISAVLVGNWPHEFALVPSQGKKGGRRLPRVACGVCGRFLCVYAAKKAQFLGPVQPLSARNNMGNGKRCGTHFPQGGWQLAGPTDIAHCPITDCGQGGGRYTRIRQKPESRKASTLRCFTLWLRWRFLTELLITITQAIVVAKLTIPTTSGSDGRLRYGCTLPQHHPHRRQEHLL